MSLNEQLIPRSESYTRESTNEDCLTQLVKIKQMNDAIQMTIQGEIDTEVIQVIKQKKIQMKKEIQTMREMISKLEKKARTQQQKNKIKKLKADSSKEIERFGQIMKGLVQSSFASQLASFKSDDNDKYMDNKYVDIEPSGQPEVQLENEIQEDEKLLQQKQKEISLQEMGNQIQPKYSKDIEKQQSQAVLQQQFMESQRRKEEQEQEKQQQKLIREENKQVQQDANLEAELMKERQEQLDKIEKDVAQMNEMMNDVNHMVIEQGDTVETITNNLDTAKEDAIDANKEMSKASKYQKKNNCLTYVIIAIVAIALIIVAILGICGKL